MHQKKSSLLNLLADCISARLAPLNVVPDFLSKKNFKPLKQV